MEIEYILAIVLGVYVLALIILYIIIARIYKKLELYRKMIKRLEETIKILHKDVGEALTKKRRLRRRYIVFTIISSNKFLKQEIEEALRAKLSSLYGIIGLAKSDPQLVYYEPELKRGIIRTSHLTKDYVLAALSLIKEVNGKKLLVIPVKTTGTIKRARKILYSLRK